jgi:hypothetical protein
MYGKWVITGIMVTLLNGCTAGFRPSLEDYKGSDAARIRAASDGNTALQFYEKQPSGCYKKVGMPESSDNKGSFINEFTVKPGQLVTVIHYWTQAGYYQNTERSVSERFIPQPNHDYDIVVTGSEFGGDSVSVRDLDSGATIVRWEGKECPAGMFD